MKQVILLTLVLFSNVITAQSQDKPTTAEDQAAVEAVVKQLFDGMRAGNGETVASVFAENARMNSAYTNKTGEYIVKEETPEKFIAAVAEPHDEVWDERLLSVETKVDGNLAQVWTSYEFYLGEEFSHCGVNAFHIIRTTEGWKILQLSDTRRRSSCDKLKE